MRRLGQLAAVVGLLLALGMASPAWAQDGGTTVGSLIEGAFVGGDDEAASSSVRLVLALTVMAILPGLLLAMTPFTRFIIVFSLLRQALGLQQSPPNQVLIGLSLALTLLVMQPTTTRVWETSAAPFMSGEISVAEAYDNGITPMREFMLANTRRSDLGTSMRLAKVDRPDTLADLPTSVVITGFVLSELRTAFTIAIKVYLPFLVVDLVVASVLLGMGMMMLPPVVVSLPFKLIVFVLMDGWGLLVTGMLGGIR